MRLRSLSVATAVALAITLFAPAKAVGGAEPESITAARRAVDWLITQQQQDGGFEVAAFPGFETPDGILAIAEVGQADDSWSPQEARSAVAAVRRDGRSPLDYVDDLSEGRAPFKPLDPGLAAKLIALVTAPLGFDARNFDPQGDGAVDLVGAVDAARRNDGTLPLFNGTLYSVLADAALGRDTPQVTIDYILRSQQANGGWDFAGDPRGTAEDPDTTALAIQALVTSPTVGPIPLGRAYGFLQQIQDRAGTWAGANPNSSAQATLALRAVGRAVETPSCRRATASLRSLQASDGRFVSPFESFGVNTFATSQAVQGLLQRWLPLERSPQSVPCSYSYWVVGEGGGVRHHTAHGVVDVSRVEARGGDLPATGVPIADAAATPSDAGVWLFGRDGSVGTHGDARHHGSLRGTRLNQPVVAGAATPAATGYWMAARDGGVFTFGDAQFFGSTGNLRLNSPIVAGASTRTGNGYWLFAADGGVFAFGDAGFTGSLGDVRLAAPIVDAAPSSHGGGYRMVAADGGVFVFGDAEFYGSAAGAGGRFVSITS